MHARRRHLFVGLATAALLAGGTTAATALTTPAPVPTDDGAQALCKRLPKLDDRIDRALTRLNGDAGTRGSVARLQQRVDNAEAAGHKAVETYLQDRLTFRKSLVTTLQQRQKDLADVKTWCQDNDNGKGDGGGRS
ncbi:hypothetical protein FNH09_28695 [Streptomyces adustus]|uniref:Secreted protein n=1 Tax=Streptomyces adustus TaxID=1609272 RepID=A0A5N8VJR0_9ACTN|nr:hypothetical protein [Streptomyces adustus]MPY35076.1 hypothetical protein [Streptomyces adustus]